VIVRIKPSARVSVFVLVSTFASGSALTSTGSAQSPQVVTESRVPNNSLRAPAHLIHEPIRSGEMMFIPQNPNPPHLVLETPRPRPHGVNQSHGVIYGAVEENAVVHTEGASHGGPQASPDPISEHADKLKNQFLHGDKQERAAAIPNANRVGVWKTPYSYGHFGASRNRQWSLHRGHKESYTQWTLR
jgi:hypothetical protein